MLEEDDEDEIQIVDLGADDLEEGEMPETRGECCLRLTVENSTSE